jgi:drug/metabolite transporter (DMT)-like permease
MPLLAFLLVIISAALHALWNFATKKVSGNLTVLYVGLWFACIVCLPFVVTLSWSDLAITSAYPFILATGIIHAIYFFVLSKAYEHGDISVVYPIARGTGVAGTALAAYAVLQEDVSLLGSIGILLVFIGTILIGLKDSHQQNHYRGLFFALFVGLMIMNYSVIDKLAVGIISPIVYIFSMFLLSAISLTPYILIRKRGDLLHAWQKLRRFSLIIGLGSMGTYLIILFTFRLANVSYVVAAREIGVVIGALLGVRFLNERSTPKKIAGISCIVLGLVMIKIA